MWKYVVKRILLAFVTAFIILSATFLLMKLLPFKEPVGFPVDKFRFYVDQAIQGFVIQSDKPINELGNWLWTTEGTSLFDDGTVYYFYKRPIFEQYGHWLWNIVSEWNWGTSTSIQVNASAINIIATRLPVSMGINIISVLISVPFGIALGIWAALKKNTPTDHIISTLIMIFISVPSFIVISLLLKWFTIAV